jgi:hypothetical protein
MAGATSQRRPSRLEADVKEIVAPTESDARFEPVDTLCAYFSEVFSESICAMKNLHG